MKLNTKKKLFYDIKISKLTEGIGRYKLELNLTQENLVNKL